MRLLACTDVALLLASLTPCWPSADGDIDSAACSSGTDHRPPPTASWSDTSHPFAALAGENAAPFLLQGSPAESWPAHSRWTPTYLNAKLTEVPTVRRARQPRLLFFTIDQFSAEFARNEDFWRLADAETAAERAGGQRGVLSGSSLALKNFRWSKLHQLHEAVPASKVTKALQRTGPSTAGSSTWYTYAAVDVYASQQVHTLLEDVSPLAGLGARREDDPRRWRASIWLGSENTTATPHYDSYHNIVVQVRMYLYYIPHLYTAVYIRNRNHCHLAAHCLVTVSNSVPCPDCFPALICKFLSRYTAESCGRLCHQPR